MAGRPKAPRSYGDAVGRLIDGADDCHASFYTTGTFHGPSLYFHRRALETRHRPTSVEHLEAVYAMLTAWGMHRMGPGGSKMLPFETFRASIERLADKIMAAQKFELREMDEPKWAIVRDIFCGIDVMASKTRLVGHSKVLHHMMPAIVPPIDRQYTLQRLHGKTDIKNDVDLEWQTLRDIVGGFFIPVASDAGFRKRAEAWVADQHTFPWDTSVLKIIDNLLIGKAT